MSLATPDLHAELSAFAPPLPWILRRKSRIHAATPHVCPVAAIGTVADRDIDPSVADMLTVASTLLPPATWTWWARYESVILHERTADLGAAGLSMNFEIYAAELESDRHSVLSFLGAATSSGWQHGSTLEVYNHGAPLLVRIASTAAALDYSFTTELLVRGGKRR